MYNKFSIEKCQKLFAKSCPELFVNNKLMHFQYFYCPISIAEADVKEYIIEEYESMELLALQLFDAGLYKASQIQHVTGMDLSLVERVLNTERQVYGHIHKTEDKLTETGLKTLAENENASDGKTIQHALYDVKRELQIEAITGTVIGINCESRKERMVYNPPEEFNSIVPRETVKIDAELSREIHERLKEYKHRGILNDGDTVQDIASIHTREVRFSRAFVAIFEKIPHPMIVLRGFKFDSRTRERKEIYVPTAISRSTANFLLKQSINIDSYLIREDEYFKYLHESIEKFDLNDVVDIQTIQKVEEQNKEQDSLNKDILEEELSQIENIDEEVSN